MIDYREIENILQTYSFEEILEQNDLTEEDVLCFLVEQEKVKVPDPQPLDAVSW